MANASPASNVGAPHWKGYGTLILQTQNTREIFLNKFQLTKLSLERRFPSRKPISQGPNWIFLEKYLLCLCSKVYKSSSIRKDWRVIDVTYIHFSDKNLPNKGKKKFTLVKIVYIACLTWNNKNGFEKRENWWMNISWSHLLMNTQNTKALNLFIFK
jgi:hypothetical protein